MVNFHKIVVYSIDLDFILWIDQKNLFKQENKATYI